MPTPVFDAALTSTLVPGSAGDPAFTFARASTAYVADNEGILRQASQNEARFQGARRVRNWVPNSGTLTAGAGWTLNNSSSTAGATDPDGGTTAYTITATAGNGQFQTLVGQPSDRTTNSIWIRRRTGVGTIGLFFAGGSVDDITSQVTSSWQRFSNTKTTTPGSAYVGVQVLIAGDAVDVWHPQQEGVSGQSNQAPSEYVSVGVLAAPYHGNAIDGCRYFGTTNGNSVPGANLLLSSQEFTSSAGGFWGTVSSTVAVNQIQAPDGTVTADLLLEASGASDHFVYEASSSALTAIPYTVSVHAKYHSRQWMTLSLYADSTKPVYFDIQNGVVGNVPSGYTARITALANGWYRCSVSVTAAAGWVCVVGAASANGTNVYGGDVAKGVYIWGAQLEPGTAANAYNPTTTAAVPAGNIVTEATGTAIPLATTLGYVAENAATNICPQSQTFDDGTWNKDNAPITPNTQVAPDGTLTADVLTDNAISGNHRVYQNFAASSGVVYTASVYAKVGTLTWMQLSFGGAATDRWANFNLATGAVGNKGAATTTASITALPNGWYRCAITLTSDNTLPYLQILGSLTNVSAALPTYVGTGQTMYLWGAQVETGSDSSSYIPTTTGPVSRVDDVLQYQMVGNLSGTLATAYTEVYFPNLPTLNLVLRTTAGAQSAPQYYNSAGGGGQTLAGSLLNFSGGSNVFTDNGRTRSAINKQAVAWSGATVSVGLNGGAVKTGVFSTYPDSGTVAFGCTPSATGQSINGTIRNVKFYAVRLTDEQLIQLTTDGFLPPDVVPVTEAPPGGVGRYRRRRIIEVEIDGEVFPVSSEEEGRELLRKAKATAQEAARAAAVAAASKLQKNASPAQIKRALTLPVPKLRIVGPDYHDTLTQQLQAQIDAARAAITDDYALTMHMTEAYVRRKLAEAADEDAAITLILRSP